MVFTEPGLPSIVILPASPFGRFVFETGRQTKLLRGVGVADSACGLPRVGCRTSHVYSMNDGWIPIR